MRLILVSLFSLLLAAALGLGSAWYLTRGEPPFGVIEIGPWQAWPVLGDADIDPYARAVAARGGYLPLGTGEGISFMAQSDSQGESLMAECTYALAGQVPPSRAWTLSVYDSQGLMPPNEQQRNGLTSAELLRPADGSVEIVLSREVQPGNWLMLPQTSRFRLALHLYGTTVSTMAGALDARALPAIRKVACP